MAARVEAILADADVDLDDSEEPSRCETNESFYRERGWEAVRDYLMSLLEDPARCLDHRLTIAAVFWGAALDGLPRLGARRRNLRPFGAIPND
ncbi:hypothetical protein H5399_09020 [Tessaracoccus sp. MC1627]|uniref:hypothetical protein n=1 Tax=Tessaracoccus sp. MC1627 TaxID=2760312 RepID=UPI0016024E6D|nr:hypothetical protein [Tessaracoccus sp. MC1627]MBB1512743.1 hypothetical protein [Tessaracoccus sp. MC1627]